MVFFILYKENYSGVYCINTFSILFNIEKKNKYKK